jgi:hypothetical protein
MSLSAGAKGDEIKAIAGKLTDAETMISVKDLLNRLGSGNMKHEVRALQHSPGMDGDDGIEAGDDGMKAGM